MSILDRANECIAQGALTNSKRPESLMLGLYPSHMSHGSGAHLWDIDGQRWLDYMCGLGCNFVGYGNEKVAQAIIKNVYAGYSHSLPTVHEVEAAEKLKQLFPFVDLFKFTKTGTLACDAAVRIARAHTGRDLVLSEGYHGHGDDFVSMTPPAVGVPKREWMAKLAHDFSNIDETVACVIVEPVIVDDSRERISWLNGLRKACDRYGVLLVFDEVITGFRYRKYGVCNNYGVLPDLICLGKAMANGMPLAAVGGKSHVMSGDYFISSTYGGEILSLAACQAVCDIIMKDHDYDHNYLLRAGADFRDRFNALGGPVKIRGYETRGVFEGSPEEIALFFQEMGRAKVIFCKSWFFNWHLAKHTDEVLKIADEALLRISKGSVQLKYPLPVVPFAAKEREKDERR